jgi:hypothetical protein
MEKSRRNVEYASDEEHARGQEIAGESHDYVEQSRDPQVFARNLNRLTLLYGLTRRQAAEKVGADYLWYRRAVTKGLRRVTRTTRPVLERIVQAFGLTTVEDLWERGLIRLERRGALVDEPDAHVNLVWRQREWWPWARKLAHILASGQHDYLRDLIDALYRTVPKTLEEPEPGSSYWSSHEGE